MGKDYDPAMHSAEHMLNQTMVRMFQCGRCVSAHIEKKKSRIDYRFGRDLTPAEVSEIERRMNETILADLHVTEEFLPRSEASKLFNLGKVPDEAGETLRIIRIGDYDACPCIGAHVASTREIGEFRIVSTSYENGLLRLRYKLSPRGKP
jgi:misacylated tRNA(Ala) deacylase